MDIKRNTDRLFTVLVAGGISIAALGQGEDLPVENEEASSCAVSLHSKDWFGMPVEQCLDGVTDEARLLELIEEARSPVCMTPFCGYWLG